MKIIFRTYMTLIMLCTSISLFAFDEDPGNDAEEGGNIEEAPINRYVLLLALIGIYYAFKLLRKKKAQQV